MLDEIVNSIQLRLNLILLTMIGIPGLTSSPRAEKNREAITIQRILLATFFVGFWCVALANIPQVAWYGKCQRVQWRLEALESLALALSQQWPDRDGEIEGLGPFVAYPIGKPSTLLLLAPTPVGFHRNMS